MELLHFFRALSGPLPMASDDVQYKHSGIRFLLLLIDK